MKERNQTTSFLTLEATKGQFLCILGLHSELPYLPLSAVWARQPDRVGSSRASPQMFSTIPGPCH